MGLTNSSSFLYLNEGHLEPGERWGNPLMIAPMRPISIHGYFRILKAFFNFLVNEEFIDVSPMAKIKSPPAKTEIKQPVSEEHIYKLLRACRSILDSKWDELIGIQLLSIYCNDPKVTGKGQRLSTAAAYKAPTNELIGEL